MTRQLFEDVGATLYRDNCFAAGRLRVNGRAADPRGINAPIIAVAHPRSRIVPPVSIDAYRTATGSRDVQILEYEDEAGVMLQHVGVLVGPNADRALWPLILQWVGRHAACRRAAFPHNLEALQSSESTWR